jgi:hypothetical protein
MFNNFNNVVGTVMRHMFTGIDNVTFDPARICGYTTGMIGVVTFFADCITRLIVSHQLDASVFAIEYGALCAGLAAIAASVVIKSKTEPTA